MRGLDPRPGDGHPRSFRANHQYGGGGSRYTEAQVKVEALRCLQCKNAPCIAGCPVQIDIPRFIALTAEGKFEEAIGVIKENSLLPAICGRVCPQEVQCQLPCTVGKSLKSVEKAVNIGRIERFVADWEMKQGKTAPS